MCIWRQCNKDPSAALGMTVLGERIGSQGGCADFLEDGNLVSQPSPHGEGLYGGGFAAFFYWAMPGKGIISHAWYEILRLSPHLFWLGFSHIERFRTLRITIRESGKALIWEKCCVFCN